MLNLNGKCHFIRPDPLRGPISLHSLQAFRNYLIPSLPGGATMNRPFGPYEQFIVIYALVIFPDTLVGAAHSRERCRRHPSFFSASRKERDADGIFLVIYDIDEIVT